MGRAADTSETFVGIALGANLGDRTAHLRWAVDALREELRDLRVSSLIDTDPVGVEGAQPLYLNGAAVGWTRLRARDLLTWLLALETARGRTRPAPGAPRTLDLDLIFYGDAVLDQSGLVVPHPRFRTRRFVLAPLAELVPDWPDPVTGKTVAELLRDLPVDGLD